MLRKADFIVRRMFNVLGVAVIVMASLVVPATTAQAASTTYHVTTGECSGTGSILEAITLANAHPGIDAIVIDVPKVHLFRPILPGYTCAPTIGSAPFALKITDSVVIDGQGSEFSANPLFADPNGLINDVQAGRCPEASNDKMIDAPVSFAEIGNYGQDNSAIEVSFEHMNITKMSRLAMVHAGASLTFDGVNAENITDLSHNCDNTPLKVESGGNLTILNSWFNDSVLPATDFGSNAFIFGSGAGNLTIRNTLFSDIRNMQAVRWTAPSTKKVAIVSSQFQGAGGITVGGTDSGVLDAYLTNSIMRLGNTYIPADMSSADVIVAGGYNGRSALHVQSSTILFDHTGCQVSESTGQCLRPASGMVVAHQNASILLTHSAVGVGSPNSSDNNLALFATTAGGSIIGDQYTWAQPTSTQNAAAINALIGATASLLRPGLYAGGFYPGDAALTPLVTFRGVDGVLIDAVPDTRGVATIGANVLRDPITNDPILADVWGNTRWDDNDKSNIGAIQTRYAPRLVVSATGDHTVDLTWSQVAPVNPVYPIDKFVVGYRPVGSTDPYTTTEVSDPTQCHATISGLTNGVTYEFIVHAHALAPVGDMPDSNLVTATPLGPVARPVVTAEGGDHQIEVFWDEPSTGGHPGPLSYYVMYRPTGTTEWFTGPQSLSGRVTVITELEPGTSYELAVFAVANDGTPSDQVGTSFAATDPAPEPEPKPNDDGAVTPEFTG
jgi:hypothetical protein